MNYPNNIKKANNKIIHYDNRGMNLEDIINKTNEYYIEINKALIYKKPTPIGIVDADYKYINKAYFKAPSTLDYNGLYKGKYIEFEAKETKNKTSFPLQNIHDHQILHIRKVIEHKGICFLIIMMNNIIYYLDGKDFINYIDTQKRKSIDYNFIKENGFELTENYLKGIDYLNIVDKLYEGDLL